MVVAPTLIPSLRSSPWIRTQPHLGFSLASRRISSRIRNRHEGVGQAGGQSKMSATT